MKRSANPDLSKMTLQEIIDDLSWFDAGHHLCRWNIDTRPLDEMITTCCEELDNLAYRAEVISWCQYLHGEAVGEDFYRGVSLIANEINQRLRIVEAIIRKCVIEIGKEVQP